MADNSEWRIAEPGYDIHRIDTYETLFALGNGNLGLRGDFEEKAPAFHRGTYLNGFSRKSPSRTARQPMAMRRTTRPF